MSSHLFKVFFVMPALLLVPLATVQAEEWMRGAVAVASVQGEVILEQVGGETLHLQSIDPLPRHVFGLLRRVADDHRTDGVVISHSAQCLKVINNVVEHWLDKFVMRIEQRTIIRALQHLDLLKGLLQFELVFGYDLFPDPAKRI